MVVRKNSTFFNSKDVQLPVEDGSIDEYVDKYSLVAFADVHRYCPDIRIYSEYVYSQQSLPASLVHSSEYSCRTK